MILSERLATTAFAFRGYNTTNLGRTPELLAHRAYGRTIERHLNDASELCAAVLGRPVDLVSRVRDLRESALDTFAEDIALIMGVELAQLEILRDFHGIDYPQAVVATGYSLGEITALVAGEVMTLEAAMTPLVSLADECAMLAHDVTMGIVFSRGADLELDAVHRLCVDISSRGQGTIAVSSQLSPNTVLILGQRETVATFRAEMNRALDRDVHLRVNSDKWPPLHTPILRQRSIPDRAAVMIERSSIAMRPPRPPILSLVTGKASYNDHNCRELLDRWIDQPQRLWDVICELLAEGIEVIVHVGPNPNLIPATFKRLSDNIEAQLKGATLNSLSLRAMSTIARRVWLSNWLVGRTSLLRAPYVHHVVLEDWLLDHVP